MTPKTVLTLLSTLYLSFYNITYGKTINDENILNFLTTQDASQPSREESQKIGPIGPPYPVTGAWFMDRFRAEEWDDSLKLFKAQGGDTVILRAPPVIPRTKNDLTRDPDFQWCGSYKSSFDTGNLACFDEAVSDLRAMGHNVTAFLSYQYEEGFSDAIMMCPKYDRRINSSRIYYRIVLPSKTEPTSFGDPCDFKPGSDLVVLFTSFAGIDPHQLLLQSAASSNILVFFGLPEISKNFPANLMPAYFSWVKRVLTEHKARFLQMPALRVVNEVKIADKTNTKETKAVTIQNGITDFISGEGKTILKNSELFDENRKQVLMGDKEKSLYDSLVGYFSNNECSLGNPQSVSMATNLYKLLGSLVKPFKKHFGISPSINLNKCLQNSTLAQHVQDFTSLAQTGIIDIIAVQEGRGAGKGSYYWDHQKNKPVRESDPTLDRIIHYLDPGLQVNVTFAEVFTNNNQAIFAAFEQARDQLLPSKQFDLWLNVQAFEYLRDDPCLPVDRKASGMGQLLNRASKERIDRALSVAGAKVQKVVSFAWDSDYTCRTKNFNESLHSEIMSDLNRPIIANCSFHTPHNLSVVVLGFNLEGETQAFTVEWTDTRGRQRSSHVHGYYFELDYGEAHHLVKSLQYVMLWDISEMVLSLAPTGKVNVSAPNAFEACTFDYDLPYLERMY